MKKACIILAIVLSFCLALSACGSDKPVSSPDAGGSTASSTTPSNKPDNSTNSNSGALVTTDGPIYLSDMLEAGGTRIWYETSSNSIGKETGISKVLVFENGKVKGYIPGAFGDSTLRTLGDASKLSDEEILEIVMQVYLQKDKTVKDEFFAAYDARDASLNIEEYIYNLLIDAYNTGMDADMSGNYAMELFVQRIQLLYPASVIGVCSAAEFDEFFAAFENLALNGGEKVAVEDLLRRAAKLLTPNPDQIASYENMQERAAPSSYVYELNVITDSTGNNSNSEKIIFSYDTYAQPIHFVQPGGAVFNTVTGQSIPAYTEESIPALFYAMNDELYIAKEAKLHLLNYTYSEGQVYDSLYSGFVLDGKSKQFVTRITETLMDASPKLDTPQHPGVTVD